MIVGIVRRGRGFIQCRRFQLTSHFIIVCLFFLSIVIDWGSLIYSVAAHEQHKPTRTGEKAMWMSWPLPTHA